MNHAGPFADLLTKMDEVEDKDATIAFLRGEVNRLQARVSELGALVADGESWQTMHDDCPEWGGFIRACHQAREEGREQPAWDAFQRTLKKTIPKGRT